MSKNDAATRKVMDPISYTRIGITLLLFSGALQLVGGAIGFLLGIAVAFELLTLPANNQHEFSSEELVGGLIIVALWLGAIVLWVIGCFYCSVGARGTTGKTWIDSSIGLMAVTAMLLLIHALVYFLDPLIFVFFVKAKFICLILTDACVLMYAKKLTGYFRLGDERDSITRALMAFAICIAVDITQLNFLTATLAGRNWAEVGKSRQGSGFPMQSIENPFIALECISQIVWLISTIVFVIALLQIRNLLKPEFVSREILQTQQ